MLIISKFPKRIAGLRRTKCPRGPHAACGPRVWDPWSTRLWNYMRTETNICSM